MIDEKGLDETTADKIGEYVQLNGSSELVEKLLQNDQLRKVPSAVQGLEAMKLLLNYCQLLGMENEILFDLSLARGLDYYTGVIYEALLKSEPATNHTTNSAAGTPTDESSTVGSIAGGGRYDNLVGMFDPRGKCVPCVGVSIGVERIFSVLEAKHAAEGTKLRTNNVDVYVCSTHKGLYEKRLKIVTELWKAGIRTEQSYKLNPKLLIQLQHCEEAGIPFAVLIGDSELDRGVVKLREVSTRQEEEVPLEKLADAIRARVATREN